MFKNVTIWYGECILKLQNFTKTLIVCSKCGMSAKKLFYQTRLNGYKEHKGTSIGYCENCKRYEIPKELEQPKKFMTFVDKVVLN